MTDEVVTRLYRCLVDELRQRGYREGRPVKVSALYQELVPYRAVRSTLGVELNADYEHALLRLLAGERGLLRLEPEQAREELRREVDAPYPFVGLFRKYSTSNVWVTMPDERAAPHTAAAESLDTPVGGASAQPPPESGRAAGPGTGSPHRIAAEADAMPLRRRPGALVPAPAPVQLHREETDPAGGALMPGAACGFCEEALPAGRRVRFCPHCGGDQRLRPCPRCDAVLERAWRYCISCGHELESA